MIDHLMIRFKPSPQGGAGYSGLYKPFGGDTPTSARILDVLTYPCSALISGLVVAGFALAVRRRFGWVVALAPASAWVVGNIVEKVGKHWLFRPDLYMTSGGVPIHVDGYDDSFPSGHTIRCMIVALCVILLWRRAAPVGDRVGRARRARARRRGLAHGHRRHRRRARRHDAPPAAVGAARACAQRQWKGYDGSVVPGSFGPKGDGPTNPYVTVVYAVRPPGQRWEPVASSTMR